MARCCGSRSASACAVPVHELDDYPVWVVDLKSALTPFFDCQRHGNGNTLGLDEVDMDDALTYLLSFVRASTRAAADAKATQRDSAMDDEQWWVANAPLLVRVLDQRTYPLAARVGAAAGPAHGSAHDPDHAYHFGLERVLDGLAVLIDNH